MYLRRLRSCFSQKMLLCFELPWFDVLTNQPANLRRLYLRDFRLIIKDIFFRWQLDAVAALNIQCAVYCIVMAILRYRFNVSL